MKAGNKDFAGTSSLLQRAVSEAGIFFLCGPDDASIQDAAQKIVSMLPDPGERVELSGADLKRDPVRLGDEARSTSLFGDTRHIWVRANGDDAHDAIALLIENAVEAAPVIVVASGATDKSRTAKLLAPRNDALVAMFYAPDLSAVTASVRNMAGGAGLKMGGELAERIARASGLDTRIARSEVEKLALFLDASPEAPRPVSLADLDAVVAQTEDDDFAPIVDAVLGGKRDQLQAQLKRMHETGINPVGLLLALERRCAQLAALASKLEPGRDVSAVIESEAGARRIFWKDKPALTVQLRNWRGPRLERLVNHLMNMHQALLVNSQEANLLLSQGLAAIARTATSDASRRTNRTS